jgi:hypothetical protein
VLSRTLGLRKGKVLGEKYYIVNVYRFRVADKVEIVAFNVDSQTELSLITYTTVDSETLYTQLALEGDQLVLSNKSAKSGLLPIGIVRDRCKIFDNIEYRV